MLIDMQAVENLIFGGTAKEAAEKTGLSQKTIESYRAKEGSSSYRDWQGMAIKTALEVLAKVSLNEKRANNELIYRSFMVSRYDTYSDAMCLEIYTGDLKYLAIQDSLNWSNLILGGEGLSKGDKIPDLVPSVYLSVSEKDGQGGYRLLSYLDSSGELVSEPYDWLRDSFFGFREGMEK